MNVQYTSEATALDPSLFGANASEDGQGEGEGAEDGAKMGVDIVFANRLMAVPFTKKDYTKYIKGYLKKYVLSKFYLGVLVVALGRRE